MPSITSQILTAGLRVARVKHRLFSPQRYAGPSAKPRKPDAHRPPRSLTRRTMITQRDFEGWPNYLLTPSRGGAAGHILYLHGGAYAEQINAFQWKFIARLAQRADRTVTVAIYPLTPEHTHRDVFPTLQCLYTEITTEHDPARTAVMGDSAGGAIALALVQSLPPESPRPADLILLSPGLDATLSNPGIPGIADRDPLINAVDVATLNAWYAAPDDPAIPEVSPINGPLNNLGRVSLFTGTRDVLNPDAHRLQHLAAQQGSDIALHEYADMVHDWMLLPIPEGRRALNEIADILNTRPRPADGERRSTAKANQVPSGSTPGVRA